MDQAEKLRKLVKEQEKTPRNIARVITVTSGKGGVGKSSIAVNLAMALSRLGKRVVILDADFGLANIEVMLGIRPKYNLADLMFRGKSLTDIITNGPDNIGFISGGSGIQELTSLTRDQIIYLIQKLVELDEKADIIIIDTGAGIADTVLEFVAASSEVLLIATPEPTSITDAYALLKTLNRKTDFSLQDTVIKMVANRIGSYEEGKELYDKLNLVVNKFLNINMMYLGSLPHDNSVSKAVMRQKPAIELYPNSSFTKTIEGFADILCENEPEAIGEKKGIAQLFSNLLRSRIKNSKKQ
ncbi:MinD/ParA family protein [Mobilitalea sibirica]|uniref:MinD/ParA family protein n=1 Tax=Mobilitalea sibirica TaxID=1462919 RepID=A0A8J7HDG0_9FIRM|nr:MinD/ParA family protein [Mobilitalea sibirica]MBH1942007.1 MinD/ParA family protein [Mobilitalea sibirica]